MRIGIRAHPDPAGPGPTLASEATPASVASASASLPGVPSTGPYAAQPSQPPLQTLASQPQSRAPPAGGDAAAGAGADRPDQAGSSGSSSSTARPANRIPLWVDLRHVPVNKRLGLLHAIGALGAEHVLLDKGDPHVGREGLDAITVDGHQHLKHGAATMGRLVRVKDAKSQARAATTPGIVVVEADDWRVIPLENLVAARTGRPGTLYARARSPEEAALFARTLEAGVHGIVLAPASPADLYATDALLRQMHRPGDEARHPMVPVRAPAREPAPRPDPPRPAAPPQVPVAPPNPAHAAPMAAPLAQAPPGASRLQPPLGPTTPSAAAGTMPPWPAEADDGDVQDARNAAEAPTPLPNVPLVPARITRIGDGGFGERVCVDATSLLQDGEGLLVGSTARSFCLVHAETLPSPFVPARPFRVNAGAVHSYVLSPQGRTRYLSELRAGDRALAVDRAGRAREVTVGRCKVERRPHTLVHWATAAGEASAVLQTAETVRLVRADGKPVAVTELKVGDEILVHNSPHARHVGVAVDESLEER